MTLHQLQQQKSLASQLQKKHRSQSPLLSESPPQVPVLARMSAGFGAAHLAPNKPLVVSIPEGAHLVLLSAALASDAPPGSSEGRAPTALRCRVPSIKLPATLCFLQHNHAAHSEYAHLQAMFSAAKDGRCALAAEGPHAVHVVGCYTRTQPLDEELPPATTAATASGKASVAGGTGDAAAAAVRDRTVSGLAKADGATVPAAGAPAKAGASAKAAVTNAKAADNRCTCDWAARACFRTEGPYGSKLSMSVISLESR